MAENCTIYCRILNVEEISSILHSYFPSSDGDVKRSMQVYGTSGSLRFSKKQFRERGDEFSRLLLSTSAFIDSLPNTDSSKKDNLTSHIYSCKLVLGVVADPTFDADDRYTLAVFAIAKALEGVVFNGQEMLDANGEILVGTP